MGKSREIGGQITVAVVFIAFVLFATFMWNTNEAAYDAKMDSAILHRSLRVWHETRDPLAVSYRYVGNEKTRIYHFFISDCAMEIRSTELVGFDSKDKAIAAGYEACPYCLP